MAYIYKTIYSGLNIMSRLLRSSALILLSFLFTPSIAQIEKIWETRYQQTGYSDEQAIKQVSDTDGNIYVLGKTNSDPLVLKYDDSGKLLWSYQFGRGTIVASTPKDIAVNAQGECYVLLDSPNGLLIVKLSSQGTVLWSDARHSYSATALLLDGDELFVVCNFGPDVAIKKYSPQGELLWEKIWNVPSVQHMSQGAALTDSRIVVWGYRYNNQYIPFIANFDRTGELSWSDEHPPGYMSGFAVANNQTVYYSYFSSPNNYVYQYDLQTGTRTGPSRYNEQVVSILFGKDNSLYITERNTYKIVVFRYPSGFGSTLTINTYDKCSLCNFTLEASAVDVQSDTLFWLVEKYQSPTGVRTKQLIMFAPNNTSKLVAEIAAPKNLFKGNSVSIANNHDVILTGTFDNDTFNNDLMLIRMNPKTGVKAWEAGFSPSNTLTHLANSIAADHEGNVVVAGGLGRSLDVSPNHAGTRNFGVVKYDSNGVERWKFTYRPEGFRYRYGGETIMSHAITSQNEIIVTGHVQATDGENGGLPFNLFTLKLSAGGQLLWVREYAVETSEAAAGFKVVLDEDDNSYILFARKHATNYASWRWVLIKYDPDGNLIWERTFGSSADYHGYYTTGNDTYKPIMRLHNNELYIAHSRGVGLNDKVVDLRKFDRDGNELMTLSIGINDIKSPDFFCGVSPCVKPLQPWEMVFDKNNNIYLGITAYYLGYVNSITSLSPTGAVRWSTLTHTYDYLYYFADYSFAIDDVRGYLYSIASGYKFKQHIK